MGKIRSEIYNLRQIIKAEYSFNIPIYQRLYVWTAEQVKTLFEDIYSAWRCNKNLYYIGGVITVPNKRYAKLYDLVDGQQRFTTLWLLANEMKGPLLDFAYMGEELRLKFAIRKNVENYFNNIGGQLADTITRDENFGDLVNISKARILLQTLIIENLKTETGKKKFAQFILENVKLVITQVPEKTDLNKLFETLNNRGEQLRQHEILKARLLKYIISSPKRQRYATLWNVCSEMDEYLERTIAKEIGSAKDVAANYNGWLEEKDVLSLLTINSQREKENVTLQSILKNPKKFKDRTQASKAELNFHPEANDDEFEPVRSILTFPQVLLHTLRIFLFKNNLEDISRINEKELLKTFEEHFLNVLSDSESSEKDNLVKAFIKLLFEVRQVFDRYIIKWISIGDEKEEHLIKDIYKQNQRKGSNKYYLRREKKEGLSSFALLQSILYHSQQNTTQYWLTPLLYRLVVDDNITSFDEAFKWLRILDNTILSSDLEDTSLSERTWKSMENYLPYASKFSIFEEDGKIKKYGTQFPHYWFYKIEFVLWHYREYLVKQEDWKGYKITAKNSIEHIGPQNPRYPEDKVCMEMLDAMGNLVLVTRSINSEYSDMSFSRKKSIFVDKKTKGSLDSLKSDLIYDHESWNDHTAEKHHEKILELIQMYFDEHNIE